MDKALGSTHCLPSVTQLVNHTACHLSHFCHLLLLVLLFLPVHLLLPLPLLLLLLMLNLNRWHAALKYPVGLVVPKGASGFAPKASTAIVVEPDYAALARGEPGFTVPGTDLQDTPPLGDPSAASGIAPPHTLLW